MSPENESIKSHAPKNNYSAVSIILPVAPYAILIIGWLLVYLAILVDGSSGPEANPIGWLFVILLWLLIPLKFILNILSIIFGIIGIKRKNTRFAWIGIIIVSSEFLLLLVLMGVNYS